MAERVKVYEEGNKKGLPIWAWLLPLLLLLALLAYFLTRHKADTTAVPPAAAVTQPAPAAFPALGTVHFETDKATLTPEGQATLDKAADVMKNDPSVHLRVEGFTDASGAEPHNQTLSQQRAYAVANYLKGKGIDGSRLTGEGFASANPINTNATESGKADNRRVELFSQK